MASLRTMLQQANRCLMEQLTARLGRQNSWRRTRSSRGLREATVNPSSWPNYFLGTFVRPTSLVPSAWAPHGWRDPGLSMYCASYAANLEHPNAFMGLRLPNALEYFAAISDILRLNRRGEGEFQDLDEDAAALLASRRLTAALEEVTDHRDSSELIVTYQKSLNIFDAESTQKELRRSEVLPTWAIHAVGLLGGSLFLALLFFVLWLTSALRQRHKLHRKQQAAWQEIVEAAERYSTLLGCPVALVSAIHLFDLGCLVTYETLREEGKLRVLDTIEKVDKFKKRCLIIFLSHQWFTSGVVDPTGVNYKAMCAAVREIIVVATCRLDKVFLWVDFCSIPQERYREKNFSDFLIFE